MTKKKDYPKERVKEYKEGNKTIRIIYIRTAEKKTSIEDE